MRSVESSVLELLSESDVVGVIKQIADEIDAPQIGIGDDAALVNVGDAWLVLTLDTMAEGVHFLVDETTTWRDVGWKLAAANISDLAAMGAEPIFALVGLNSTRNESAADIAALYSGIQDALTEFGGTMVGGDTVVSDKASISMTMIGTGVNPATVFRLDAAKDGDAVAVSGTVGDSRGGLEVISTEASASDPFNLHLIDRHLRPTPRIDLCREMVTAGIRCATDVSDGLVKDLEKVCKASALVASVDVDSVPMSLELSQAYPDRALEFALSGGEDFELLVIGDRAKIESMSQSLDAKRGTQLTIIGEMKSQWGGTRDATDDPTVVQLYSTGLDREIPAMDITGWDHWSALPDGQRD